MTQYLGQANRFAYDAKIVAEFFGTRSCLARQANGRVRRVINGKPVNQDTDARILRRWTSNSTGATRVAVLRLLKKYNIRVADMEEWAADNNKILVIRNKNVRSFQNA